MLDVGAHHSCRLVLQALFMTASVPTATSTIATRTMIVRRYRQQRRLTQEQLAFEAKIDLTYMGGIERGKRNPSLLVMARIADALAIQLPKLLSE
jgi:DNA-binding XRE family transcriptional regulator